MSSLSFTQQLRNDVFQAYEDARKNKRNTTAQLEFEKDAEQNLIELFHELLDGTYLPGKSICFLSYSPVLREVFASQFRDRVVHHLLFNYIAPIFETQFIYDSYSCRKEKGTLFGIERLEHHIRSCTNNYTENAFVLKLDIQGYFMSINKHILYNIICNELFAYWEKHGCDCSKPAGNLEFILWLIKIIIFKDHTLDCKIIGDKKDWMLLPASKSLFNQPKNIGLPIGDLTSQLFSNIYLNELDQMIKRRFKIKHYGRYVDDFYIIHPSKAYLKSIIPEIRYFLIDQLGLILHPKKIYLQLCKNGVPFLGAFVKPYRKYAVPRSVNGFRSKAKNIISLSKKDELSLDELEAIQTTLNSYLGYLGHFESYKIIHKSLTGSTIFKHMYFASGYKKTIPYKRYRDYKKQKTNKDIDLKRIFST